MRGQLRLGLVSQGFLAACLSAAQVRVLVMNHVDPIGADIQPMSFPGYTQIFPDYPLHSCMVVDDFVTRRATVTRVWTIIEVPNAATDLNQVEGYRVSTWANPLDAAQSGINFTDRTLATELVPPNQASLTELFGTGASYRAILVELPTDLEVPLGRAYIGVAPILRNDGQRITFAMQHLSPSNLGAGTPDNAYFLNPGMGFGFGSIIDEKANAALKVEVEIPIGDLFASVPPSSFVVRTGRRISGDVQSLRTPDDDSLRLGVFMVPNTVVPPIVAEMSGTAPRLPEHNLAVSYRTRATSAGSFVQTIELFNYALGSFDAVKHDSSVDTTYGTGQVFADLPVSRFLSSSNEVRVRVSYRATAPTAVTLWGVDIDSIRWDLFD